MISNVHDTANRYMLSNDAHIDMTGQSRYVSFSTKDAKTTDNNPDSTTAAWGKKGIRSKSPEIYLAGAISELTYSERPKIPNNPKPNEAHRVTDL